MSVIDDAMKKKGMKPSLEIEIGKGAPPKDGMDDESGDDLEVSDDELQAMKEFEDASTPEDKAMALKAFIKLC